MATWIFSSANLIWPTLTILRNSPGLAWNVMCYLPGNYLWMQRIVLPVSLAGKPLRILLIFQPLWENPMHKKSQQCIIMLPSLWIRNQILQIHIYSQTSEQNPGISMTGDRCVISRHEFVINLQDYYLSYFPYEMFAECLNKNIVYLCILNMDINLYVVDSHT